ARYSPGSTLGGLLPGGYVVLGNPGGATGNGLTQTPWIQLRSPSSTILDEVELGGGNLAGDGAANNAPAGSGSGSGDEAVVRLPNGDGSSPDNLAFSRYYASPGQPNDCASTKSISVNTVSSDAGSGDRLSWSHSTSGTDRFLLVGISYSLFATE